VTSSTADTSETEIGGSAERDDSAVMTRFEAAAAVESPAPIQPPKRKSKKITEIVSSIPDHSPTSDLVPPAKPAAPPVSNGDSPPVVVSAVPESPVDAVEAAVLIVMNKRKAKKAAEILKPDQAILESPEQSLGPSASTSALLLDQMARPVYKDTAAYDVVMDRSTAPGMAPFEQSVPRKKFGSKATKQAALRPIPLTETSDQRQAMEGAPDGASSEAGQAVVLIEAPLSASSVFASPDTSTTRPLSLAPTDDIMASSVSPVASTVPLPSRSRQSSAARQSSVKPPEIKGATIKAQQARIASRVACVICEQLPSHLQKNCPRVKAGVESLQELLTEREEEEPDDMTEASTQAIKAWIDRLTTVRNKVMGLDNGRKGSSVPSSAPPNLNSKQIAAQAKVDQVNEVESEGSSSGSTEEIPPQPTESKQAAPHALPNGDTTSGPSTPKSPASATPEQPNAPLHPLYLKALSRPRKAGSLSGLSTSDAVIETGGSSEGGSSNGEDGSGKSSDDDQSSSEGDEASHSGASQLSGASDDEEDSSGNMDEDDTSRSDLSEDESIPSDQSLRKILTATLNERQKRAARQSAASILPADLTNEEDDDQSSIAESSSAGARKSRKGGSVSSIGDFGDAEEDTRTSEGSEIKSLTQPPAVVAASNISSPESRRSSRSFMAHDEQAGPSPVNAEFDGDIAMREAIEEEDQPEREAMQEVVMEESAANQVDAPRSHVISQGLPSPPSSNDNELVPETIAIEPGNGDLSQTISTQKKKATRASLAPPVELEQSGSGRRLRSASREVTVESVSPQAQPRRTSQVDELDSSQLFQPSPDIAEPSQIQAPPHRTGRTRNSPLFMTQPSQAPASQAYDTANSSDPPETQSRNFELARPGANGRPNGTRRVLSRIIENKEEEAESRSPSPALLSGHSKHSSSSTSEDESSIVATTKIYPPLPRHQSSSQPQSSFPSLSSLPKDLLRIGRSVPSSAMGTSSQPAPLPAVEESDGSDTSSSEEEVPASLKGRYAGGSGRKTVKTGGVMNGW